MSLKTVSACLHNVGQQLNEWKMPRTLHSSIDKIRAELAWVNETPDPNKWGCKFSVDLAPGTYRFRINLGGTYWKAETITVDEKTSDLKLKLPKMIEVIQGTPRLSPLGPRA